MSRILRRSVLIKQRGCEKLSHIIKKNTPPMPLLYSPPLPLFNFFVFVLLFWFVLLVSGLVWGGAVMPASHTCVVLMPAGYVLSLIYILHVLYIMCNIYVVQNILAIIYMRFYIYVSEYISCHIYSINHIYSF